MTRIRVLSPVGQVVAENFTAPPLPADLQGLTVGFIDNTKHNFDRLADEIGTLLRALVGGRETAQRQDLPALRHGRYLTRV